MKRNAFTLIELLFVIGILALLTAVLMPSVNSAVEMARRARCASNLHQISATFPIGQAERTGRYKAPFPSIYEWPSNAQTIVEDNAIFFCPEGPPEEEMQAQGGDYALFLRDEGPEGMYVDFQPTDAHPWRLVFDRGDYLEYWFEDGKLMDIDGGVDFVFYVSKTVPRVAVFQDVAHVTWRVTSVTVGGKVLPGWEDLSLNAKGDRFVMDGGGLTNYGLNGSAASRHSVGPDTIVLLDYDRTIANEGEDMAEYLERSARHMGSCNVLYADGSVAARRAIDLDPLIDPEPWTAD